MTIPGEVPWAQYRLLFWWGHEAEFFGRRQGRPEAEGEILFVKEDRDDDSHFAVVHKSDFSGFSTGQNLLDKIHQKICLTCGKRREINAMITDLDLKRKTLPCT
jgi:hypothetical protein